MRLALALVVVACSHDAPPPAAPVPAGEGDTPGTGGIGYKGVGPADAGSDSTGSDTAIYGGLVGNEAGSGSDATGGFGYGSAGFGPGGSSKPDPTTPKVKLGQPSANGDLDKAIVRRYIKRKIKSITACYAAALQKQPALAGTITTQFTIDKTGHVSSATAQGLDTDVASCVAGVIQTIEFPTPKDGSDVVVNYPFTFSPPEKTK